MIIPIRLQSESPGGQPGPGLACSIAITAK
jgi:hypothetical protein